jgi:hypothetical protein
VRTPPHPSSLIGILPRASDERYPQSLTGIDFFPSGSNHWLNPST